MTRKLKTLGLALVAVFALSAVVASAAQAVTHEIVLGKETGILTGTTETNPEGTLHAEFKVSTILGTGAVKCHGDYSATATNGAKEVTIHPTYEANGNKCEAFGGAATVKTNDCAYIFEAKETDANGHAPVEIECAEGSSIEISVPSVGCLLKVGGGQTPGQGVHYTNVTGAKKEVTLHATVTGITFTKNCSFVTGTTGTYTDTVLIKAYEDKKYGNPTTPEIEEGAQIDVSANPGG